MSFKNACAVAVFLIIIVSINGDKYEKPGVSGLFPAVFTPFDDQGKLNLDIIPDYAKYLRRHYFDGLLVAGTSGEGPSLSLQEKKDLLKAWVEAAQPMTLKVIMQVGGAPLPEVLELAKISEESGAAGILTLPELYFKPKTVKAVVDYLNMVSQAAPTLPLYYYHHPSFSGVNLNIGELFAQATLRIPNFKGVKCDFLTAMKIISLIDVNEDQTIFTNSPLTIASSLVMGLNSSMASGIGIFPQLISKMETAFNKSDMLTLRTLQITFNKRFGVISSHGDYTTSHKAAMVMVSGIQLGDTRDPLPRMTSEQKKTLRDQMEKIGVPVH